MTLQESSNDTLERIQREVGSAQHRFTVHSIGRAGAHGLTLEEVEQAILSSAAVIIEDYPTDPRGPSCLIYGTTARGAAVHVVCSHAPSVAVITCYQPDPSLWHTDLKARKRPGP
jgi:hypothetical protein